MYKVQVRGKDMVVTRMGRRGKGTIVGLDRAIVTDWNPKKVEEAFALLEAAKKAEADTGGLQ